jgi:hypothetical protein
MAKREVLKWHPNAECVVCQRRDDGTPMGFIVVVGQTPMVRHPRGYSRNAMLAWRDALAWIQFGRHT